LFPRYVTIQRPRKPLAEVNVGERAPDIKDGTTEIGPVYTGTTERQLEARTQSLTSIRAGVTEDKAGSLKVSRGEDPERATSEPELKVSSGRKHAASSISTYPQYVDVTSIGRRHHITTPELEIDATSVSPIESIPYIEINSFTRRRNIKHDNNVFTDTAHVSSSLQPHTEPPQAASQPQDVNVTSTDRSGSTGSASNAATTSVPTVTDGNRLKHKEFISSSRGSIVPRYSGVSAPAAETDIPPKHISGISRSRGSALPSNGLPSPETQTLETDTAPNIETISPPTTPVTFTESTPQIMSIPNTVIPPTSTGFTPTVTRVITSVTESGSTERQRISVNRVPYIAIAALRGETVYPGSLLQNRHPTLPTNHRIFHPAVKTTVPFLPEFVTNSSVEQNTIPVTMPTFEKVMEVNRITHVTLKEELPVAYTQTLSGNAMTEKMLIDRESNESMDKLSEVSRMKYVTVVGGSQTATPAGDHATDTSRNAFTTLSTVSDVPFDTRYLENATDSQRELQSEKPLFYPSTSSFKPDNFSTYSLSDAEPVVTSITSKETESTIALADETSFTNRPLSSVSPVSNRRYQASRRKTGVDGFKERRTSTSVAPITSSSPPPFSHKRRGQRKRPRPYRPTSTAVSEEEAAVLPRPDGSKVANGTADTKRNSEPRRTFVPKRGQRRRPRPYLLNSTSSANADEVKNPVENGGSENIVLLTETINNTTTGFVPKRGNRQRGTTQKPATETSNVTSRTEIGESRNLKAEKELEEVDTYNSSDNAEPITRVSETFIPQNSSRFIPTNGPRNRSGSTEPNSKPTYADDIEVTTIKHSHSTESFNIFNSSLESEFDSEADIKYFNPGFNVTEKDVNRSVPQVEETIRQTTFTPTSVHAYTEPVTPASAKPSSAASAGSGTGHGDRLRIKKKRRRPVTPVSVPLPSRTHNSLAESASEVKTPTGRNLKVIQDEIKFTSSTADRDVASGNPDDNSVVTFPTDALLQRDHYEVTRAGSVGDFVGNGDREGKGTVMLSALNNTNHTAGSLNAQRSKSVSVKNSIDVKTLEVHDSSNDFENPSYVSEITTVADNDLSTGGSSYAAGNTRRDSLYTPTASVRPPPEEVPYSVLTAAAEFPTEGYTDGNSRGNSEATVRASTRGQHTDYFIPSVDFTAESADNESLGSRAATGRNKPGSSSPDGKTWRLVRRKRPKSTTEDPQVQSEVG
jgi:hypothetical protein